jgi:hypothetical protein
VPRDALLYRLAFAAHLALAISVALAFGTLDLAPFYRLAIAAPALLPLAATIPALLARRRAVLPWLATALVLYAGLGAAEVIARGHPAAVAVLLLALLELALALRLIRAAPPRSLRGSAES